MKQLKGTNAFEMNPRAPKPPRHVRIPDVILYHGTELFYFARQLIQERWFMIISGTLFIIFYPVVMPKYEYKTFRVVLDPGHGGTGRSPMSIHGDRYDSITGRYLDLFKEGASRGDLHEHAIVYSIAKKTERYLRLLAPGGDNARFYRILEKYTDEMPERINIITYMSRKKSLSDREIDSREDPNAAFRLFDFPDADRKRRPGRLSRINGFKPHLVVSLHLADSAPRDYEGMNPVVAPPYEFLHKGLEYLQGKIHNKKFFYNSRYSDWFTEAVTRSDFDWFLNDVSLYFSGYPLRKNRDTDRSGFKGYRNNMVEWAYADDPGWEFVARYHIPYTRYAQNIMNLVPDGKFWDRERSRFERYRRDDGEEGFGGDNAYASYELVRYMLYSLFLHGDDNRFQKPGKSYVSVWIVPLHVNAISAFIELGYLNRARDRLILTKKQDEIAEGIAVGIYSLFTGMAVRNDKFKHLPRGKKLDLEKYSIDEGASYFEKVAD